MAPVERRSSGRAGTARGERAGHRAGVSLSYPLTVSALSLPLPGSIGESVDTRERPSLSAHLEEVVDKDTLLLADDRRDYGARTVDIYVPLEFLLGSVDGDRILWRRIVFDLVHQNERINQKTLPVLSGNSCTPDSPTIRCSGAVWKSLSRTGILASTLMLPLPVQFLVAMLAYGLNERMARKAEYLREENRVLKEALQAATGKNRIPLTHEQRRRLATKGKALTPAERDECCQIVRPSTILAWFRRLVARKYDSSQVRRPGRPRRANDIRELVLRIAGENAGWGYTKIRDALRGLKIEIGRTTVANILAEAGFEPAPERNRKRTWKQFLRSHWETLYACDFFSVETLGVFGTVRYMVFFVMELKTRAVQIAGIRVDPGGAWMLQVARTLLDPVDGFLRNATHLIHDRDPLYTKAWTTLLKSGGVKCVRIPAQSPNCTPHAERFVRTIRTECLDPFVIFGERHLRYLVGTFVDHYLTERFHQGLGGQLIRPQALARNDNGAAGTIRCRSRLGGLLNFYHREAA
jgi:putative transposase